MCPLVQSALETLSLTAVQGDEILHRHDHVFHFSPSFLSSSVTNWPLSSHRPESSAQHCRQRSGSLESQSHLLSEMDSDKPFFSLSKSQRSSSTEILDDGSSYTSQSSTEYYCVTPVAGPYYTTQTLDTRARGRRRSKKQNVSTSNSGSMPNLAQKDSLRNGVYTKSQEQPSSSYYIAGYTPYAECDLYYSGGYVYENDTEGQYSVNPSYRSSAHYGYERQRDYSRSFHEDEVDHVPHNPYATLRLPRKAAAKSEHITKNIHKALVAEHLRGWYQRASGQKDQGHSPQTSFDSDRGSQRCLGFAGLQVPCSPSSRTSSYSSGKNAADALGPCIKFTSSPLPMLPPNHSPQGIIGPVPKVVTLVPFHGTIVRIANLKIVLLFVFPKNIVRGARFGRPYTKSRTQSMGVHYSNW